MNWSKSILERGHVDYDLVHGKLNCKEFSWANRAVAASLSDCLYPTVFIRPSLSDRLYLSDFIWKTNQPAGNRNESD